MIGSTVSHYRIVDEIGRGGMGVVYRAEDTRLGRTVALKFLAEHLQLVDEARERFMVEARAAARITDPHIATLYDVVDEGDVLFIAMEYVRGRDLSVLIREQALTVDQSVNVAVQIARGLVGAHGEGIIHRDIKPANILVTDRGEVKILDFGLAKLADTVGVTQEGTVAGSATYMSPEQIRGGEVDERTDLWSLGAVLHELLAFEPPFKGDYREAVFYAVLNVDPPTVSELRSGIPPALDGVVRRLLAKDAAHRYASAREVVEALTGTGSSRAAGEPPGAAAAPPAAHLGLQEGGDGVPAERKAYASEYARRAPASASATPHPSTEERRQMTVVHAEIARFGDLTAGVDPEDLIELMQDYATLWDGLVRDAGGLAGPVTGGTFRAYFGYPVAAESDARRALQLGLELRDAVGRLAGGHGRQSGERPGVRVGVHTGMAVVGDDGGEVQVRGNVGEIAARIAESVPPGSVVTSKVTRGLGRGYYDFESLGKRDARGFSDAVEVFGVLGKGGARTRLDFIEEADLSPLVGRDTEMAMLRQRWKHAESGRGSAVLVAAEAGLGKSRLVDSFVREVSARDRTWHVNLYCSSLETSSALHPLTDYLKQNAFPRDMPAPERFDRLKRFLGAAGIDDVVDAALMADLLGVPLPADLAVPEQAAAQRQRRTMISLYRLLTARCADDPGLLVIEDLHWADPSTLEWVSMVVSQAPTQPLLVISTTRPHFRPAWLGKPDTAEISLNKLDAEDLVAISEHKSGKKLPQEILQQIVAKTDGVPLFTEELTHMILEMGILVDRGDHYELKGALPEHIIPTTLHGSLVARLDRLPTAKAAAQVAAVVGREFSFDLLKRVAGGDDDAAVETLPDALQQLVDAELIYQRGFMPEASFIFKHALIQDAAYETLLKKRRRELHERVARTIEEGGSNASPELIAYHYTRAGAAEKAVPYWLQAGKRAMARYENREAVQHFTAGRELVGSLPAGPERDLLELSVLVPLGHALNMTKGYWAPEGEAVLSRAAELCESVDEVEPLVSALLGLSATLVIRGDYAKAREVALRALDEASASDSQDLAVVGEYLLTAITLFVGDLPEAVEHSDAVAAIYDPQKHAALRQFGSGTLDQSAYLYRQFARLLMGYPEEARRGVAEQIGAAAEGDYHFDLYQAYLYSGLLDLGVQDWDTCRARMETYLTIGREYGDPFPIMITTIVHHLAQREEADLPTFRSAKMLMDQMRGAGYGLGYSVLLGQYAAGLMHYGDLAGAEETLEEAFDHLRKLGAQAGAPLEIPDAHRGARLGSEIWRAEIHRLLGELQLAQGQPEAEAEASFQEALVIAQAQKAVLFELRAANSLARLRIRQQRFDAARELVAGRYASFTEGFDERDLRDARDLLDSLPEP